MNKQQRKLKKSLVKTLNQIHSSSEKIAKSFDLVTIPVNTFRIIIDKSKFEKDQMSDKHLKVFMEAHNNTMEQFFDSMKIIAGSMNGKNIPVSEIKKGVEIIKTAYDKGVNNK